MATQQGAATFSVIAKDAASTVLRSVGKEMGSLGKTGKAVFKTMAVAVAAVASAITGAAIAAAKFAKSAISAAMQDQAEQAKLIAVLEARGLATEANRKQVDALIKSGQALAFTDSEIRAGLSTATQFTNDFTKAQKILAVAQDVARAKGMSLEEATALVGKAFAGNAKGAKQLGIDLTKTTKVLGDKISKDKNGHTVTTKTVGLIKKQITGQEALNAISAKFGGVAEKSARTAQSQFTILGIKIGEAQENIGFALLPAVLKVFDALQPVVDDLLGELEKRLPDLEAFANTLADEIIAKIPGFIAAAKEALPGIIKGIQDFITGVVNFGTEIVKTLGPGGLVTAGLVGIGAKIGGFSGALAAAFTKGFSDIGFGPFQAMLLGTITGAVVSGVVTGLASAAVTSAITALTGKLGAASAAALATSAAGALASAGAGAAGAAGAVGGFGAATIAGAAVLPFGLAAGLKALGVTQIAQSGLTPAMIAQAQAGNAGKTSVNTTLQIGRGAVTKASSVVSQASRTQVPSRATAR
jgi:NADH:ubiquinone oxidoreductase subunit K